MGKPNFIKKLSPMRMKKMEKIILQMPEIRKGKGIWQNTFHEFDVYNHTIKCVKYLKTLTSDPEMIVAGYFHDIAKPVNTKPLYLNGKLQKKKDGKNYHEFEGHEMVGEKIVNKMNPAFFVSNDLNQKRIAKLVGAHYLPMRGIKSMRKAKNIQEFKKRYLKMIKTLKNTRLPIQDIILMFLADNLAKGKFCKDKKELLAIRSSILTDKPSLEELYNLQKRIYGGKK